MYCFCPMVSGLCVQHIIHILTDHSDPVFDFYSSFIILLAKKKLLHKTLSVKAMLNVYNNIIMAPLCVTEVVWE